MQDVNDTTVVAGLYRGCYPELESTYATDQAQIFAQLKVRTSCAQKCNPQGYMAKGALQVGRLNENGNKRQYPEYSISTGQS